MFSRILGKFLVEQSLISADELEEVLAYQKSARVKLGLIAVSERLMTEEQTARVNALQAVEDKRFGDIAVEQGFLTERQVERLLKLQGNPYLVFVQAMTEKGIMSLEDVEHAMDLYQQTFGFTSTDMEDLRSGEADRIVPLFVRSGNPFATRLAGVAVRTIIRLIDSEIAIGMSYESDRFEFENLALQYAEGEHHIMLGLAGEGNSLLTIADVFAGEEFEDMNEFSFDSICEFINCINGLNASALSTEGVQVDMLPPSWYQAGCARTENKMLIVPIYIKNRKVRIVIAVDSEVNI